MDQYRLGLRPLGPYGALGHHPGAAPGLGLPPGMVQGWGGLKAEAEKEDRERKEKEHLERLVFVSVSTAASILSSIDGLSIRCLGF